MNCPGCGHYFNSLHQMKKHRHCEICAREKGKPAFFANATALNQHKREVHKWSQ